MRYRVFGSTGMQVSEIGFGCARIGGIFSGSQTRQEPLMALLAALAAGVNYFDTADMYTQGESERLLGRAIRGRRDSVIITSKGGYCLPTQRKLIAHIKPLVKPIARALGIQRQRLSTAVTGSLSQDFSPAYLIQAVEGSLHRLGIDYIDLYLAHSPPTEVIISGEFIETLERLRDQGKFRFYGVACDTVEDALLSLEYPGVAAVMFPFGLLDQEAAETLLPLAAERGVALIGRGCFGGGLLKPGLTEEELQTMTEKWPRILALRRIAAQHDRSSLELALQYCSSFDAIPVHLLGMRTVKHVQENLGYLAAKPLSQEELEGIRGVSGIHR